MKFAKAMAPQKGGNALKMGKVMLNNVSTIADYSPFKSSSERPSAVLLQR